MPITERARRHHLRHHTAPSRPPRALARRRALFSMIWSQLPVLSQVMVIFGFAAIGCVVFAAWDLMSGAKSVPGDLLHPIVVGSGVILAIVLGTTVFQIRKRSMREQAVAESQRELTQILAAATRVAVIATDPKGVIRQFNTGAEWMLGFAAESVVGRQSPTVFHLPAELAARSEEVARSGGPKPEGFAVLVADADAREPQERLWTLRCRDGGSIRASIATTAVKDGHGRTTGYLFIARDVTREQNALKDLHEAKRIAEEANETKSHFVANISHEIRTPMTAILGYADLLEDEALEPTTRLEHVRTIRRNGDHLLAIINDILDMERIASGKLPIEFAETPLPEIVREVVDLMRVRANAKGLFIQIRADAGIPGRLRTDAMRVRQILVNLVGNAIKFTDRGGICVTFETRGGHGGRMLAIRVADTGIGIRSEQLDRLFEPFTQADSTSTRRHGGSGLGLAISRRLARLLGGDLEARSTPNEGSIFTLTLPLEGAAAMEPLEVPTSPAASAGAIPAVEADAAVARSATPSNTAPVEPRPVAAGERRVATAASEPKPSRAPRRRGLEALLDDLMTEVGPTGAPAVGDRAAAASVAGDGVNQPEPDRRSTNLLGDCRILLVEDAADTRRLLSLHLGRAGANLSTCEDGQQAVDRLAREGLDRAVDLVLMDMQMPGLDGYEATRQLRALGFRRPIVALTAHASTTDREKCLACGCDDYASKPIDAKALIAICQRWRTESVRHAA